MSTILENGLPSRIVALFDGRDVRAQVGAGYLMVTTDPDGKPRPCMLSAGEILAVDRHTIRVALWAGSHTSRNLARDSSVLLCVVDATGVTYVRGTPLRLVAEEAGQPELDCYEIHITAVESDEHRGLPIRAGITFAAIRPGPDELAAVWTKQLALLASARKG
jgi:hypothetical protein